MEEGNPFPRLDHLQVKRIWVKASRLAFGPGNQICACCVPALDHLSCEGCVEKTNFLWWALVFKSLLWGRESFTDRNMSTRRQEILHTTSSTHPLQQGNNVLRVFDSGLHVEHAPWSWNIGPDVRNNIHDAPSLAVNFQASEGFPKWIIETILE